MNGDDFFREYAFGDVYAGTFFEDDFPQNSTKDSERKGTAEDAQISAATSKVRMPTDVDVSQQVTGKLSSMYALNGNLSGGSISPNFNGVILSGI